MGTRDLAIDPANKNNYKNYPVFQSHFSFLLDQRRVNKDNCYYPLKEILFLAISVIICELIAGHPLVSFTRQRYLD